MEKLGVPSPMTQPAVPSDRTAFGIPQNFTSRKRATVSFWLFTAFIITGLLVYSQTWAFVWDEGFHFIAAQLIKAGKRPYLDFCFPQTPLNAYFNAALMWFFGDGWRIPQLAAAFCTAGALILALDYIVRQFPDPRWKLPCAFVAAAFLGLNSVVMLYGTVAQAYGMGLFFCVAAFRAAVASAKRHRNLFAFAAGFFASTAAAATLLSAPELPVLLLWLLIRSPRRSRIRTACSFLVGAIPPFLPVLVLWLQSPSIVFFNIVTYQAIFRRYHWEAPTEHDIEVLSAWLDSGPALLLVLLCASGLVFLFRNQEWRRELKSEAYLAAALGLSLTAYIATAHPTFERYFIFAVPFLAMTAATGLYAVGRKLASPGRPFWPAALLVTLLLLSAGRALFEDRESVRWGDYQNLANKVAKVTPRQANLYADELVYFLLNRTPPPGMEFSYSHKLELPTAEASKYHIVSEHQLNDEVKAGRFATVQSCNDDRIDAMKLPDLFAHQEEVGDCRIFWGFKGSTPASSK